MLTESEIETCDDVARATCTLVLDAVVAIPVCNEGERIAACLTSLEHQESLRSNRLGLVLFLNNCTDETGSVVADFVARSRLAIRVITRDWAGAHAGWARREAMEAAARWLRAEGVADGTILTTDADSRVPSDWVARNLAAVAAGADAVAGRIALDAAEAACLPDALHARGRREGTYEALLTELAATIDPVPHDPWPNHWTHSGATLAVRLSTYERVGGMPAVAVGEDRAFVARLLAHDARIRHAPDIAVVTSGRLEGRAPGGAADTMRLRCEEPESPCDERLEALPRALFRYVWRRRLRGLHAAQRLDGAPGWVSALAIAPEHARSIARSATFGEVWTAVEAASPRLGYVSLTPHDLPPQIRLAWMALALVRMLRRLAMGWTRQRTHFAQRSVATSSSVLQTRISPVGPDHTS